MSPFPSAKTTSLPPSLIIVWEFHFMQYTCLHQRKSLSSKRLQDLTTLGFRLTFQVTSFVDYEHSLFPSSVRRASEKDSARKINRRRAKTLFPRASRSQFSRGADLFFSLISFAGATDQARKEGLLVIY